MNMENLITFARTSFILFALIGGFFFSLVIMSTYPIVTIAIWSLFGAYCRVRYF